MPVGVNISLRIVQDSIVPLTLVILALLHTDFMSQALIGFSVLPQKLLETSLPLTVCIPQGLNSSNRVSSNCL